MADNKPEESEIFGPVLELIRGSGETAVVTEVVGYMKTALDALRADDLDDERSHEIARLEGAWSYLGDAVLKLAEATEKIRLQEAGD